MTATLSFSIEIAPQDPSRPYREGTLRRLHGRLKTLVLERMKAEVGTVQGYADTVSQAFEQGGEGSASTAAFVYRFGASEADLVRHWFELALVLEKDEVARVLGSRRLALISPNEDLDTFFARLEATRACDCRLCTSIRANPRAHGIVSETEEVSLERCKAMFAQIEQDCGRHSAQALEYLLEVARQGTRTNRDWAQHALPSYLRVGDTATYTSALSGLMPIAADETNALRGWAMGRLQALVTENGKGRVAESALIIEAGLSSDSAAMATAAARLIGPLLTQTMAAQLTIVCGLLVRAWSDPRLEVAQAVVDHTFKQKKLGKRTTPETLVAFAALMARLEDDRALIPYMNVALQLMQHDPGRGSKNPIHTYLRRIFTSPEESVRLEASKDLRSYHKGRACLPHLMVIAQEEGIQPEWGHALISSSVSLPEDLIEPLAEFLQGSPGQFHHYSHSDLFGVFSRVKNSAPLAPICASPFLDENGYTRQQAIRCVYYLFNHGVEALKIARVVGELLARFEDVAHLEAFFKAIEKGKEHASGDYYSAPYRDFFKALSDAEDPASQVVSSALGEAVSRLQAADKHADAQRLLDMVGAHLPEGADEGVADLNHCILGAASAAHPNLPARFVGQTIHYQHDARFSGSLTLHGDGSLTWSATGEAHRGISNTSMCLTQPLGDEVVAIQWRSVLGTLLTAVVDLKASLVVFSGALGQVDHLTCASITAIQSEAQS